MKKRAMADEENAGIHPGKDDVGLPRVDRDEEAHEPTLADLRKET
jgi:hypothetical protein